MQKRKDEKGKKEWEGQEGEKKKLKMGRRKDGRKEGEKERRKE